MRMFEVSHSTRLSEWEDELMEMMEVLMGREEPPVAIGPMTMMEVAEAYHARASEIEMTILRWERKGHVKKGEGAYRFRTGELRSFIELCKRAIDLGSRRITALQIIIEERERG